MRVISRKRLREFWERHPDAETPLTTWLKTVEDGDWTHFAGLRLTFPSADQVTGGESGKVLTVFNIGGNKYRLVCRIVYQMHLVFTLMVMTHAEYSKGKWIEHL